MTTIDRYRARERQTLEEIAAELNAAGCDIDHMQCWYVIEEFQARMVSSTLSPRICIFCKRHPSACACYRPASEMVR